MLSLLLRLLSLLPLPLLHGTGVLLGQLFSLLPCRQRRTTLRNLELCFAEISERQRVHVLLEQIPKSNFRMQKGRRSPQKNWLRRM